MEGAVEDLGQQHEELRGEVSQIKQQMSKMLEMLQSMKEMGLATSSHPSDIPQ